MEAYCMKCKTKREMKDPAAMFNAKGSPVLHPLRTGLMRTANWMGFHGALVAGAIYGLVARTLVCDGCLARISRNDRNQLLGLRSMTWLNKHGAPA